MSMTETEKISIDEVPHPSLPMGTNLYGTTKVFPDYQAEPGQSYFTLIHGIAHESSVSFVAILQATRALRKGFESAIYFYGPGSMNCMATRGFPTTGNSAFPGEHNINNQLTTFIQEGGKVYCCRFGLSLHGLREEDLIEGVIPCHPLDVQDALIHYARELALLSLGGELDDSLPEGWQLPQFDVSPILAAAEAAAAAGHVKADLELQLPAGAEAAATERLRLVDHADALAREGRLLSAPALPEVAVCRHWIYTQIAEQAAGFPAQAWALPHQLEPAQGAAGLSAEQLERLARATEATVVADDANRIIFVNEAAGEVLGWVPEALVGQRLTVLIPPELRAAHLAGFSRLKVTGEPRILGQTLHVPALRRDGSMVKVALVIEEMARHGGRTTFHATLAPTADEERLARA